LHPRINEAINKMKAIILVGGFGTRLRPLTFDCPKSVVPFCNLPMVEYQLSACQAVGVKEVILAINYQPELITCHIEHLSAKVPP
jgi:mannose-1-phosphate guanylyltransferase